MVREFLPVGCAAQGADEIPKSPKADARVHPCGVRRDEPLQYNGAVEMYKDFAQAVRSGMPPRSTPAEALADLQLIASILRSSETGKEVRVSEVQCKPESSYHRLELTAWLQIIPIGVCDTVSQQRFKP